MWLSFTMKGMRCTYLREARPERAQRGRDGAAVAGERELQQVQRVEVGRVLREARRGGVLDALVDREDGEVSGAAEAAVVEQRAEIAQHGRGAVAVGEDAAQVVGARQDQVLRRERLGRVARAGRPRRRRGARGDRGSCSCRPAYRRVGGAPWWRDVPGCAVGLRARSAVGPSVRALHAICWVSRTISDWTIHATPDAIRSRIWPVRWEWSDPESTTSRASGGHERSRIQGGQAAAPAAVGAARCRGRRPGRRAVPHDRLRRHPGTPDPRARPRTCTRVWLLALGVPTRRRC